jgi:hypothetical protein
MNLKDYKFIIASGCSYATTLSSLDNKNLNVKLDTSDNLIFIEVGCASQGSDWAYDSVIYTLETLLRMGVESENIYCFVEWTQIERITINQPAYSHQFLNDNIAKEKQDRHFYIKGNSNHLISRNLIHSSDNEIIQKLYDSLNIKCLQDIHNVMSIDGLFYITPHHTDPNGISKLNDVDFEFYFNIGLEYELHIPMEIRVKKYLDNILNLQRYLKYNSINYNFAMMQSQFSGWELDSNDTPIHKYTKNSNKPAMIVNNSKIVINSNLKENLNISESSDLIKIFPQFKPLFNQIDLSNWWFYNKGGYRYGGIDEYALEEFGLYGYLFTSFDARVISNEVKPERFLPSFGYHPNAFVHVLLVNEMMFNNKFFKVSEETISKIKNMVNEDIESKNITKHNLTISKNEIKKYIELI